MAQAAAAVVVTEHVRAELLANAPQGILPGKPVTLGLALAHQPHWHTYWKNPGDSGLATTLSWTLPPGFTASDIAWPAPQRLPLGPLVNYGYEGQVLLPVSITVPASHAGGPVKVALHAEWLVCKEICLPESGDFALELPAHTPVTQHRARFDAARAATPVAVAGASASARVQGKALAFEVRGLPPAAHGKPLQFFAEDAGVIDYAGKTEQQWQQGVLTVRVPLSAQRSESPAALRAVLAPERQHGGWAVTAPVAGGWPGAGIDAAQAVPQAAGNATVEAALPGAPPAGAAAAATAAAPADATPPAFLLSLLLAFIGGALLNLMPCVFPVLSLKIFGFTRHAGERRKAVAGGLAYTAGVVLSFTALAGLLLALRAGGAQLGWGFQLQSPAVVAALSALFTLIGLNLAGVFEFGALLPGSVAGYRAKNPLLDDALSGVLAVAVASPCTAPFMGAALGVALTEPAPRALAVFAVLGLGMAAPYLLAALSPQLARLLPKPGAWMLRFKAMMAFPMFATVVWLLWVLGQQTSVDAMAGMAGALVALAYACWTLHTPVRHRRTRAVLAATGVLALAATVSLVWPLLQAEHGATGPAQAQGQAPGPWAPWSADAVAQARRAGKPVFVDFTAAWCVTCQFNKRTVLNDKTLMAEFNQRQVVLLRADWTRRDPAITRQLAQLGRSGVPVYALYGVKDGQPQVLSELLTVEKVRAALGGI
jgi:thiol:disulfide interchange protein DsbD